MGWNTKNILKHRQNCITNICGRRFEANLLLSLGQVLYKNHDEVLTVHRGGKCLNVLLPKMFLYKCVFMIY